MSLYKLKKCKEILITFSVILCVAILCVTPVLASTEDALRENVLNNVSEYYGILAGIIAPTTCFGALIDVMQIIMHPDEKTASVHVNAFMKKMAGILVFFMLPTIVDIAIDLAFSIGSVGMNEAS